MTNPRLSICIATYNRASYIGETLESIIPQITEDVEVVVVDGASTDDTCNVVKSYMNICPQINYVQLLSKGGVDQDYCLAVEHARGEMCWLFSDDDLLKPDAVKTVLEEVQRGYSLIVVNTEVMNKNLSGLVESKRLKINENEVYSPSEMEQLFRRAISYMSFIGCVIVNRDLWLQRKKKCYFGTEFIHVGVIFQEPLPAPALIIAKPYITIRYGNAQWTSRSFEIWMFKWPNLLRSFACISEKTRNEYKLTNSWLGMQKLIISRAKGVFSLKEYRKWLISKELSLWWRMMAFSIALVPSSCVNLLLLLYLKIIQKKALLTIYDLENNDFNVIKKIWKHKQ
jgi:abequosyltransferase